MNRCSICDYLEGHGSNAVPLPRLGNKVQWRKQSNAYICDDCITLINSTIEDYKTLKDVVEIKPDN